MTRAPDPSRATAHAALLRAVNLAGHNKVGMADLRALLSDLGFADPRSLLQSGNLVFRSTGNKTTAQLERILEDALRERLDVTTDFFVRNATEWEAVIADNPFPEEAKRDPGHLLVVFLKAAPTPAQVANLQKAISGREVVRAVGRHAYITYPDGIGRSKLTSALIEKHLGTRGTGRNWNTVGKIGALLPGPGSIV